MIRPRKCWVLTKSFCSLHRLVTGDSSMFTSPKTFTSVNNSYSTGPANLQDEPDATKPTDSVEDKKMKVLKLEMSLLHERGGRVPDLNSLKKQHWEELMTLNSYSARRKFYNYLFVTEKRKEHKVHNQHQKQEARNTIISLEANQENEHINYSLGHTTFFLRIGRKDMNLFRNNRLIQAMQFGEKLIFDCSYDQYMNPQEARNAAKQLAFCFATNRKDREPFDLHFCNVNFDGLTMQHLERIIPVIRSDEFPLNIHEGSYLDLFPESQLVYLTPHCKEELTEYDPDKIYIVGAMVDKRNAEPLSLAKAKKLNLKMARLPLEKYLQWSSGSGKALTLDQMTNVMLTLKKTRNFVMALQHVPRRKVV